MGRKSIEMSLRTEFHVFVNPIGPCKESLKGSFREPLRALYRDPLKEVGLGFRRSGSCSFSRFDLLKFQLLFH